MTENPRHDGAPPLPGPRSAPTNRPGARRALRAARIDWLTGQAAEQLLSGRRVHPQDAVAAETADRLARLLSAAAGRPSGAGAEGPLTELGFALDPAREEAALAAFRAARAEASPAASLPSVSSQASDVYSGIPEPAIVRTLPVRRDSATGRGVRLRLPGLRSVRVATAAMAAVLALGGVAAAVAAGTGRLPVPGAGSGAPAVTGSPGADTHGGGAAPATTVPPRRGGAGLHGTVPTGPAHSCPRAFRQDTDRWYGSGAHCAGSDRTGSEDRKDKDRTGNGRDGGNSGQNEGNEGKGGGNEGNGQGQNQNGNGNEGNGQNQGDDENQSQNQSQVEGKGQNQNQGNGQGQNQNNGQGQGQGNGQGQNQGQGQGNGQNQNAVKDAVDTQDHGRSGTQPVNASQAGATVRRAAAPSGSGRRPAKSQATPARSQTLVKSPKTPHKPAKSPAAAAAPATAG
ncbi:hypothetical protein [Streptomyces sp. NPDC020917]|uniref:hypothetical protein n=1 Tax=Streptomyces sp. NPDC020917 TaxID=3365102 RepID=UPI0037AB1E16